MDEINLFSPANIMPALLCLCDQTHIDGLVQERRNPIERTGVTYFFR